jgi:hypothetical protein
MQQIESNVQSLINLCEDIMPHQTKKTLNLEP